jgi:hypothetical protein
VAPIRWNIRPQRAHLHRVSIFIGRIPWYALNRVRRLIQRWQVNNSSRTWNCQEWVVEIVEGVSAFGVLADPGEGAEEASGEKRELAVGLVT